jgi:hypothetical protein
MRKPKIFIYCLIVFLSFTTYYNSAAFLCGDANGDAKINLLDAAYIINAIYRGGPTPNPWNAADVNNSGKCDLLDVSYLISRLYRGGMNLVCPGDDASGGLIGHGSCKNHLNAMSSDALSGNQDGIAYDYDGSGILSLQHLNAAFNCCPIFVSIVTIEANNIVIKELDSLRDGGCSCLCIFDLDYAISNLSPGLYHIRVIEPYVTGEMELLEFDVDLSVATSGFYFVLRDRYPWTGLKD